MNTSPSEINAPRSSEKEGRTMTVMMGDVVCRIRLQRDTDYELGMILYGKFLTDRAPDITIDLDTTENTDPEEMARQVADTVFSHEDNRFWTNNQLVAGRYDLAQEYISITAERPLGDPGREFNHLNRLMTLLYYSACRVKYGDEPFPAMFLHSCAILRNEEVDIFAGPSGIGKTTVATLCRPGDGTVINDEMILVHRPSSERGAVLAQGGPIIGGTPARSDVMAPVGRIFLLKQSNRTRVQPVEGSPAYLRLIRQVVSPVYIGQVKERAIYERMADFSAAIIEQVPVYELEFTLDADSLWETVATVEK